MRDEVLQAEVLLRCLLAEHRDCTPARLAVADYMVERGDLDGALQWLRTPQATADMPQVKLDSSRHVVSIAMLTGLTSSGPDGPPAVAVCRTACAANKP